MAADAPAQLAPDAIPLESGMPTWMANKICQLSQEAQDKGNFDGFWKQTKEELSLRDESQFELLRYCIAYAAGQRHQIEEARRMAWRHRRY